MLLSESLASQLCSCRGASVGKQKQHSTFNPHHRAMLQPNQIASRDTGFKVRSTQAAERAAVVSAPCTTPYTNGTQGTAPSVNLDLYNASTPRSFELVIAGAGPSGLSVAERVSAAGFSVCIVDPDPLSYWPNNYGVWIDEFEAMGLADCLEVTWPKAKVFLGSSNDDEKYLYRPYGRVDRAKLKQKLIDRCIKNGVKFYHAKADSVTHSTGTSTLRCSDGTTIEGSMVLDATGHVRKLVKFDKPFNPGYQGAYGILAEVESHPFELDTMLFMDWRDDHTADDAAMNARNSKLPTFLYAMPFSKTRIFLEETSLVARPAVSFPELKERLEKRMKHLGIKVKSIEEEEYCLIPMGSVLPTCPQRVLGIGGTGGMVHPSTGYMVARMLGAAPTLADSIIDQLASLSDKNADTSTPPRAASEEEANTLTANVWRSIWPVERIRQREFFNFGMEVLLTLDLAQTREFFRAFFSLSDYHWQGFLSSRLGFLELIGFGLTLFAKSSNQARVNLLAKGLPGLVVMLSKLAGTLAPQPPVNAQAKLQASAEKL